MKYGAQADCCTCRDDAVNIDMRNFLPYADKETKKIIEENFVSDSDSDSESEAASTVDSGVSTPEVFACRPNTSSRSRRSPQQSTRRNLPSIEEQSKKRKAPDR